jgi:hypothetical protein
MGLQEPESDEPPQLARSKACFARQDSHLHQFGVVGWSSMDDAQTCRADRLRRRSFLALKADALASCPNRSRSLSDSVVGTTIRTVPYRSPCPPRDRGIPLPRSLSRRPLEEPAGTRIRLVPVSVGTSTVVPSAASAGASVPAADRAPVGIERPAMSHVSLPWFRVRLGGSPTRASTEHRR